jgi:APA family basic amino acid/polyamine antiporter
MWWQEPPASSRRCYAEFAAWSRSGSAYTYAYTTLGELFAWIIGWDLILEYAVSAATVTHDASAYFQDLIGIFGLKLPDTLSRAPFDVDALTGKWVATGTLLDSPALVVTALVTVILVIGIKESASFNAAMVVLKLAIVVMVIGVGVSMLIRRTGIRFSPYGLTGVSFGKTLRSCRGSAVGMLGGVLIFFAYIGLIPVDSFRRGTQSSARRRLNHHSWFCTVPHRRYGLAHRNGSLQQTGHQRAGG